MDDFHLPGEHVYNGMVMYRNFPATNLDRVHDFKFRKDDVLIDTYPKAGTTWTQQIVWHILNGVDNELAQKIPLTKRSRYLEREDSETSVFEALENDPSPRIIKSHLPYSFFKRSIEQSGEDGVKIVITMRNLKDTIVSFYNFYCMNSAIGNFNQGFDAFFRLFQAKKLLYGDYIDHLLSWWKEKENPNIFFVWYEDLQKDTRGEIVKLADFLGKNLSESELEKIVRESSFSVMKNNPMTNMDIWLGKKPNVSTFYRKGVVGDWKNYFSEEQSRYVDTRSRNELRPWGLEFEET